MSGTHPYTSLAWSAVQLDTAEARALVAEHATSPGRKEAVSPAVALRRATGRALALRLLQITVGGEWTIGTDPRGKPLARGASMRHISISHSGGTVAAAVSAIGPIGIDVERHNPGRRHDRLAERAFGPAERASAARLGDVGFYRVWTLREAISKATGDGMALAADGIDRIPQPFLDGAFTEGAWVAGADGWVMAAMALAHDLSLAVAIQASAAAPLPARRLEELRIAF